MVADDATHLRHGNFALSFDPKAFQTTSYTPASWQVPVRGGEGRGEGQTALAGVRVLRL